MKRTGRLLPLTAFILGGAVVYLWSGKPDKKEEIPKTQQELTAAKIQKMDQKKTARQPSAQIAVIEEIQSNQYSLPSPEAIQDFKDIQQKVFKSSDESERKNEILNDAEYLKKLSRFLRNTKNFSYPQFEQDQNTIIDILVAASQGGDSEAALEAIYEVVKDAQVENTQLDPTVRNTLAGVKAELLYTASALNPTAFIGVERFLPGPVSQKIWQNVQEKQRDHQLESEAELARN